MKYLPALSDEPVAYFAVLNAIVDCLVAFGLPIDPAQKAAIGLLIGAASAIFVRAKVTPTASIPIPPSAPLVPAPATPPPAA